MAGMGIVMRSVGGLIVFFIYAWLSLKNIFNFSEIDGGQSFEKRRTSFCAGEHFCLAVIGSGNADAEDIADESYYV